jgi:hypothetical protein
MESEFNGHLGICFQTIKAQSVFVTKMKRKQFNIHVGF